MSTPSGTPASRGQRGEAQQAQRGLLGRLDHERVPGGQRRRDLPHGDVEGVVPGHHDADHPQGLLGHQGQTLRSGGTNLPVDLVQGLGVVAQAFGRRRRVLEGVADRLAHVEGDHGGQLLAVGLKQVSQFEHRLAPVPRCGLGPGPGLKGAAGGGHGQIDVGRIAGRDLNKGLARDRAHTGERLPQLRVDELPVDERPVLKLRRPRILSPSSVPGQRHAFIARLMRISECYVRTCAGTRHSAFGQGGNPVGGSDRGFPALFTARSICDHGANGLLEPSIAHY